MKRSGQRTAEWRMLAPGREKGRQLGRTPFLDFFFFFCFLISRIFYCFCPFVCDYSAFHHLHIGENSKGEGALLCKSWLWGGRDLPPSTQSAKARDSPSGPAPPPANHTRSPTSGSASRVLLLGLRITDSYAKTEEVRDCS